MTFDLKKARKSKRWKSLRTKIWIEREHFCYICGYEIPADVSSTHPLSYELEHITPAKFAPELFYEEENLALSHQVCNRKKNENTLTPLLSENCQKAVQKILKEENSLSQVHPEEENLHTLIGSHDFF